MTREQLRRILGGLPRARVCVLGDLFLDRYMDIDRGLAERSLETGLEAHQVIRIRAYPGAGGTVAANLAALEVGRVAVVSVAGEDGHGYELRQALCRSGIDESLLLVSPEVATPTYTKPLVHESGRPPVELSRLDVKNRAPLPARVEAAVLERMDALPRDFDAVVVADQVQERNCGVVTDRVRARLADLAARSDRLFVADSRCRMGEFRNVILKPNRAEAAAALGAETGVSSPEEMALALARRAGRAVFLTLGAEGLLVACSGRTRRVGACRVSGEIDAVGAGDSTTAGIAASLCAGATNRQAGLVGCLVASLTIQQIGVTGTATREQVERRFAEYCEQHPDEEGQCDEV